MSSTDPAALAAAAARFPALQSSLERSLQGAGPYLADLIERAAPTQSVLHALSDELARAERNPRSVAHPELLDPDTYWAKAAWPQAAAMVTRARQALLTIADDLAPAVAGTERILEELVDQLAQQHLAAGVDPPSAQRDRDAAIDAIALHCEAIHRTVERLSSLAPPLDRFASLRAGIGGRSRRHQEMLVTAHERAVSAIARDVHEMVRELTAPILGIGERLVHRYDELAPGRPAPAPQ